MINRKFTHYYVHGDNTIVQFDLDEMVAGVPHVLVAFYNDTSVKCYYQEYDPEVGDEVCSDALEKYLYTNGIISEDDYVCISMDIPDIAKLSSPGVWRSSQIVSLVSEAIEDFGEEPEDLGEQELTDDPDGIDETIEDDEEDYEDDPYDN